MNWNTVKKIATRKPVLGTPPAPNTTLDNLSQPETFVAKVDGRTLRAKGNTAQLSCFVKPEFRRRIKMITAEQGITVAELLEHMMEAYDHMHEPKQQKRG